jgi:hypothetical protein
VTQLTALAARCDALDAKVRRLMTNPAGLSTGGQAVAVALAVSLELGLLAECAAALRAEAAKGDAT